jgi:hypothetical protein
MAKSYLTEEQVEAQEHLSAKRLKLLEPKFQFGSDIDAGRPIANLIDLMHWVKNTFGPKTAGDLSCWIHNKIVIDGAFLEFAENHKVQIETLYLDSIASWRSSKKFEHFMAQGVFKITCGKLSFLHAALFHKGNQNEDEVSFFVIMNPKDYDKYLEFRNMFDNWLTARDREHLEIKVIGGEGLSYNREASWDEIFLPDDLKKDIRGSVEDFLNNEKLYKDHHIPWKRGILFYGEPGCGKSSLIKTIIANCDIKPVTVNSSTQTNDDTISEAFAYAQEQGPSLLYLEDLDTLLSGHVTVSHFLNLLDGVYTRNGILVIATANVIHRLKMAVTDRPSRFDRKIEIPLPTVEMSIKYLKNWFGKFLTTKEYSIIAKQTYDMKFSYAYLKELYITSAFDAIAGGRKDPNMGDVKTALARLLKDKNTVISGFQTGGTETIGID